MVSAKLSQEQRNFDIISIETGDFVWENSD